LAQIQAILVALKSRVITEKPKNIGKSSNGAAIQAELS